MYVDHVKANFDLQAIENSNMNLIYDAMYGAGMNVIKRLLPNATLLHCDDNPGFKGVAPEPIYRNLKEFSNLIFVLDQRAENSTCKLMVTLFYMADILFEFDNCSDQL